MYDENDSECWTAAANSKTENIMRRRNTALYEKNGNDLQIPLKWYKTEMSVFAFYFLCLWWLFYSGLRYLFSFPNIVVNF